MQLVLGVGVIVSGGVGNLVITRLISPAEIGLG